MERLRSLDKRLVAAGAVLAILVVALLLHLTGAVHFFGDNPSSQAVIVGAKNDSTRQNLARVEKALEANNPKTQAKAFVPEYRSQLGDNPALPKGTDVKIDRATFWSMADYADVEAVVGHDRYLLLMVRVDGKWYIFSTEKLEDQ